MRLHLAHLVYRGIRAVPLTAGPGKFLFTLVLIVATQPAMAGGLNLDTPDENLGAGRVLMETGHCVGAVELFDEVVAAAPGTEEAAEAHFLAGQCLEADDALQGAVERYGAALAERRCSAIAVDARFRRGLVRLALDEPHAALRDFRHLQRGRAASTDLQRAKLELQLASCHHGLGRSRRATDLLLPALETLTEANAGAAGEGGGAESVWYLAQAHVLAGDLIGEEMGRVSMDVPSVEEQRQRLDRRLELFEEARQHYRWVGHLSVPLWVCAAGYKLGQLYECQRIGVLQAPPPSFLSTGQQAAYDAQLRETLERWQEQAMAVYRDMLSFAAAAGVQNRWVDLAEDRLAEGPAERLAD